MEPIHVSMPLATFLCALFRYILLLYIVF